MTNGLPIGEMNDVELILGLRGYGKSTYCASRALILQAATGAYVIGHSLGARFPNRLPDGTPVPLDFYPTIEKLDAGLRRNPNRIAILVGGNGDEVIKYARRLSMAIRKKAYYQERGYAMALFKPWNTLRPMDGIVARPIVVIIDEGVALGMNLGKTSAKNTETKDFREAIYGARHEHIAYLFQIQDPNAIGPALQTQASRYIVFRLEHEWALNAVRAAGASREDLQEIRDLELGEYIEFGPSIRRDKVEDAVSPNEKPNPEQSNKETDKTGKQSAPSARMDGGTGPNK